MANEQNLRPSEYKLSREEAKRGGIASGESRRRKATLRKAMQDILDGSYKDSKGNEANGYEVVCAALFKIASNPKDRASVRAFQTIMELMGEGKTTEDPAAEELNKLDQLLEQVHDNAIQRKAD